MGCGGSKVDQEPAGAYTPAANKGTIIFSDINIFYFMEFQAAMHAVSRNYWNCFVFQTISEKLMSA